MPDSDFRVHLNPLWRERANFLIHAKIQGPGLPGLYEQLWTRKLSADTFELCCIPFFVYDLALGDVVETPVNGELQFVLSRVVWPSGHLTLRAWFGNSSYPPALDEMVAALGPLGCQFEAYSKNLVAVDAPTAAVARQAVDHLAASEARGHLEYETGWS